VRRLLSRPSTGAIALAGVAVALLDWRVGINAPAAGLDPSWNAALAMATKEGLRFGQDIVFSYGPLGFLHGPYVWYGDLGVLAFLYTAAIYVGFCVALVWALRRALPLLASAALAFLLIGALAPLERSLLLAILGSLALLEKERPPRTILLFAIAGGSLAAIEALVKLSTGPIVVAILLIALIGARARWPQVLAFLVVFAVEVSLLWALSGQSLGAVPDFLANTREIISGYSGAMIREVDVAAWKVTAASIAAALTTVALVVACAAGRFRDRRALVAGMALMGIAAFTTFKEGVVRTDAGHLSLYFSAACVLWIAIPWARSRWGWLLAGAVTIALIGLPVRPPEAETNLNPVANLRNAVHHFGNLFSSSRRQALTDAGRAGMKATYRLDRETRAALSGHSVAIEPWEAGVAWAYELDWEPLPVFQNYSAYTSELDDLNAEAVADQAGPERVLRENPLLVLPEFPTRGLDSRFWGWDPPRQQLAVLCNFAPVHTTRRWQVLGRIPNRCGKPRMVRTVAASEGEAVSVPTPAAGEIVLARIHGAGIRGLERLTTLLFHARVRRLVVDGNRSYRLVPETAADGLLLRGRGPFVEAGEGFSPLPQARTIAVERAGDDLRFDFFRVRVKPAGPSPPAGPLAFPTR
jgi:hypothetical protein